MASVSRLHDIEEVDSWGRRGEAARRWGESARMAVPGGWLYKVRDLASTGVHQSAVVYVPDPEAPHVAALGRHRAALEKQKQRLAAKREAKKAVAAKDAND